MIARPVPKVLAGRRRMWLPVLILSLGLVRVVAARAQVKVEAWYYLGDVDDNARAGQPIHATVEAGRHVALTLRGEGGVTYTGDVSSAARKMLKDTLAAHFNGLDGRLIHAGPLTQATDNFGVEVWAKAETDDGFHCVVRNGGRGGFAIVRNGEAYQGYYPGVGFIGWSGDIPAGQWVHLALVRDNGKTTFYVDGRPRGRSDRAPSAPGAQEPFTIGAQVGPEPGFFRGAIDEVRLFTFEPGRFSVKDLLLHHQAH